MWVFVTSYYYGGTLAYVVVGGVGVLREKILPLLEQLAREMIGFQLELCARVCVCVCVCVGEYSRQ